MKNSSRFPVLLGTETRRGAFGSPYGAKVNKKMQQSRTGKGVISAEMKAQIDENLKRVYQEALSEEVPDRFKDLLAQLKAKDDQR
jgi:hypothetical protein